MKKLLVVMSLLAIFLVSCNDTKTTTMSYDEVKKIMVDAVQTEEGKKAIRQLFEEKSFRELLVLDTEEVKKATEQTLLSKEAEGFWKKTFEDPAFKEALAKSMQKQQEDILKDLLNDASYQEDLTSFFGQPDMQKQLETILKGAVMRKELEKIVMETIENPLMQTKWQELIRKSGETGGGQEEQSGGGGGSEAGGEKKSES